MSKRRLVTYFLIVMSAGLLAAGWWALPYLYSPKTYVTVSGVVLDSQTDAPVADARVVVTLANEVYGEYAGLLSYGLITDKDGRFSLDVQSPTPYDDAFVETSIPTDEYCFMHIDGAEIVVRTAPLTERETRRPELHYHRFRGNSLHDRPFIFVGERWPIDDLAER